MSHTVTRSLLLIVALAVPACTQTPEYVGATSTTTASPEADDSSGAESGASTTTSADETTTSADETTGSEGGTSTTSAGPDSGAYGSFCELVGLGPDIQFTAISSQPICDGGICLVVSDEAPLSCSGDPECAEEAAGSVCGADELCTLAPAFLEENARCTQTCELDEDCPEIPGCVTGVSCSAITLIGELCCQKVCACNDHLDPAWEEGMNTACENDPELCS